MAVAVRNTQELLLAEVLVVVALPVHPALVALEQPVKVLRGVAVVQQMLAAAAAEQLLLAPHHQMVLVPVVKAVKVLLTQLQALLQDRILVALIMWLVVDLDLTIYMAVLLVVWVVAVVQQVELLVHQEQLTQAVAAVAAVEVLTQLPALADLV